MAAGKPPHGWAGENVPDKILNENIAQQVRSAFQKLREPVGVLFFGTENDCEYCADTRQLLEEVVPLSDKLSLSVYDLERDAKIARRYHVDKAPAIVITGWDGSQALDHGIRFLGIPAGHEFGALIQALIIVSEGDSGLQPATRQFLGKLAEPVHLQVFSTPT
jgi:alkyl hydroperoxide reductase subunit AhpF